MSVGAAALGRAIPLTLITGYLGAGKTTLVNRLLSEDHGRRIAVLVNEFGEIGIDGALILTAADNVYEMANGCVCCAPGEDLTAMLAAITARADTFDAIVFETSGLADPGPILRTLMSEPSLMGRLHLAGVATVVDAIALSDGRPFSCEESAQIQLADLIVLNKVSDARDVEATEGRLRRLNAASPLIKTDRCAVAIEALADLARGTERAPALANGAAASDHRHHHHEHGIVSVSLAALAPLDMTRFMSFLDDLVSRCGPDLLRLKGIVTFEGEPRAMLLQGVRGSIDAGFAPPSENCASRLVVIGRNIDEAALREGFAACVAEHPGGSR